MDTDIYLWGGDVTRRFRINPTTLWRWMKEGRFPQPDLKQNGRNAWRTSTIEAFEQSRRPTRAQSADSAAAVA